MISAVIWDMGGIMFRYFTELLLEIGEARGWPLSGMPCGPTGPVDDAPFRDLAEGRIEESEYLKGINRDLRARGIEFDPIADLHWPDHVRPATWDAIRRIHESDLDQALLTNDATMWLGEGWWETWEPAHWFDEIVDVVDVGVRKPAPEPYLAVAAALGRPPGECIFIDDMPVNCRGAEAVGMESHWFDIARPDACTDALLARLGLEG